jgi:hypothetical protein
MVFKQRQPIVKDNCPKLSSGVRSGRRRRVSLALYKPQIHERNVKNTKFPQLGKNSG